MPACRYVFSSRRYVVLANGALTCYNAKEEKAQGGEAREQLALTPETQVVEMKVKGKSVSTQASKQGAMEPSTQAHKRVRGEGPVV